MGDRSLIINADDFGWSRGVNQAVARAHEFGTITSASLMTCGPALAGAAEIWKRQKGLGLGLHFTLTQAAPLSPPSSVYSLCDSSGSFLTRGRLIRRLLSSRVNADHIRAELEAQIRAADELGLSLTHIDGHQHIHVLPGVSKHVISLAGRRGLAVRIPNEQILANKDKSSATLRLIQMLRKVILRWFCEQARQKCEGKNIRANAHFRSFFGLVPAPARVSLTPYLDLLQDLGPGATELMVHPAAGKGDPELWGGNRTLMDDRRSEADVLLDERFKEALQSPHFRLINYGDL